MSAFGVWLGVLKLANESSKGGLSIFSVLELDVSAI